MKNILPFFLLCILLIISACNNTDRKTKLENKITVHVDTSQRILEPDELLNLRNSNFPTYSKKFKDSSIFIQGYIQHVDNQEQEVLLENSCDGCNVVCLLKDSAVLPLLKRSDRVVFKGICKIVSGNKLVLIVQCELGQLSTNR